ncbi:unnamed protein product [Cunninghamella echinulata]
MEGDKKRLRKKLEDLSKARLSLFADRDDRQRLMKIKQEKQNAIQLIQLINKKYDFLQSLINQINTSSSSSSDIKQQQDELCGFDSRLTWNDDQWESIQQQQQQQQDSSNYQFVMINKEEKDWSVCQKTKKKCQRHNGWMKLKALELEQEREEQFVILSMLARERKQIKTRITNRLNEMNMVNSLMNGTLVHTQH